MRFADITTCDIANGTNLGVVLWCQGCSLDCPGCHNSCAKSPNGGQEYTQKEEDLILKELRRPQIKRLTLSGGHPLESYNLEACTNLCKRVKAELPDIKIWCYTGYTWENIEDLEILQYIDVLVDGPYIEGLRDITLPWRGSSNQRVINVKASLRTGDIILYE